LSPLDLLIASHALAAEAVLITSDKAFSRIPGLTVQDWTT
jgi:tRNA(fMet)-specific endonuclease VapC